MSDLDALLRATATFGAVPGVAGAQLPRRTRTLDLQRGDVLIREGEPANWLGFPASGLARVFCRRDDREAEMKIAVKNGRAARTHWTSPRG